MSTNLFTLDTNILIYSIDRDAGIKHEMASFILEKSMNGRCLLTSQALGEFYCAATRKGYVSQNTAIEIIEDFMEIFPIISSTGATLKKALSTLSKYGLQFWDAILWATAKESKCSLIITEDFQDGRSIEGVQFINPFKEDKLSYVIETYLDL